MCLDVSGICKLYVERAFNEKIKVNLLQRGKVFGMLGLNYSCKFLLVRCKKF